MKQHPLPALAFGLALTFTTFTSASAAPDFQDHDQQAWAISLDNDLFRPTHTDRDFTAGLALTYSGRQGLHYWQGFDSTLGALDGLYGLHKGHSDQALLVPSIEFGIYGFTPDKIESPAIIADDRPYASLMYLSASRTYRAGPDADAWTTSLTLGVLGLNAFEEAQNTVHRAIGSDQALGWDHQISQGGELTARYQVAYHHFWNPASPSLQFKTTYFGSVGYLTEAGIALSTREGRISSPDYRFNPELISYGERVNDVADTPFGGRENYFWGGVSLKARAYNAFLQGQFRHSDHTFSAGQLRPVLAEAWIGYTASFSPALKLSYVLRAQSSEIRDGAGDRSLVWGGFVLSQSL